MQCANGALSDEHSDGARRDSQWLRERRAHDEAELQRRHGHSLGVVDQPWPVSWIIREVRVPLYDNKWWKPYRSKVGERVILKRMAGDIQPGEFVALMGPSGCGKTSLLNVLANRLMGGKIDGTVLINGKPFTRDMEK